MDPNANVSSQGCAQENGTYSCRGPLTYPAEYWNDAKRMEVLLAPFRERDVNPENYDSKMKFWCDMIEQYCLCMGTAVFSKANLQIAFTRNNRMPYCLDTVIMDLLKNKKIRLHGEYENDPLDGWTSWALNGLVWRPLTWGVNRLKSTIGKYQADQTEYVHLAALRKFCEKLQTEVLPTEKGKLMHLAAFRQLADTMHVHLKEQTLYLCLLTLQLEKKLALEFKNENSNQRVIHLIKIPDPNEPQAFEITPADHAMHQLQMTQAQLQQQLEDLETEVLILDKKVRQLVNDNKRGLAKSYLRKKHLLEQNHVKRALALQNIEELMNGVVEARSHGQILDAYKLGASALQQVMRASGLKYDKVDEVVADVRESLDTNREVEQTLATAGSATIDNSDERELELELRDIINEERVLKAPNVPQHIPGAVSPMPSSSAPLTVTIKDAELLAMLDELELEDQSTPKRSNNNISQIFS